MTSHLGADLVTVEVETLLGAIYRFPDSPRDTCENLLAHNAWEKAESVVLVNVSGATMAIPFRIVRVIRIDGKDRWTRASVPELRQGHPE